MSHSNHKPAGGDRDYADRDIKIGLLAKGFVAIAIFTALVFAGNAYLQRYWEKQSAQADETLPALSTGRQLPDQSLLQTVEVRDLASHRAWEESLTTGYAVIDKEGGVYRIPVEQAIELIAKRGLPARSPGNP